MAIVFKKQIKKQKNLILVFLALVLITISIVWWSQHIEEKLFVEPIMHFRKIKIDFKIFENSFFKELQPIEKIPDFEGEMGRKNPFIPKPE